MVISRSGESDKWKRYAITKSHNIKKDQTTKNGKNLNVSKVSGLRFNRNIYLFDRYQIYAGFLDFNRFCEVLKMESTLSS